MPTLIQWDVPIASRRCTAGVRTLASPDSPARIPSPTPIRGALAALGSRGVLPVTYDRDARLAAMLRTPRGIVTL